MLNTGITKMEEDMIALSLFIYFIWIAVLSLLVGRVFHILEKKTLNRVNVVVERRKPNGR